MGRGFQGKVAMDEEGHLERLESDETTVVANNAGKQEPPKAATYLETFLNRRTCLLCVTGFFFHFANANVLLVLGELMGQSDDEDGVPRRSAIPLISGAIVTAQLVMAAATSLGNRLTIRGVGRKPLFMAGLLSLPIRCALIILWQDAGNTWLLSTQLLDGIGGGLLGLVHPYLVADISFGSGRFNVVSKSPALRMLCCFDALVETTTHCMFYLLTIFSGIDRILFWVSKHRCRSYDLKIQLFNSIHMNTTCKTQPRCHPI